MTEQTHNFDKKMVRKFYSQIQTRVKKLLSITYSNFVTNESVRMAFIISGINNLDICVCDIGNAYLNDPCQEKLQNKEGS